MYLTEVYGNVSNPCKQCVIHGSSNESLKLLGNPATLLTILLSHNLLSNSVQIVCVKNVYRNLQSSSTLCPYMYQQLKSITAESSPRGTRKKRLYLKDIIAMNLFHLWKPTISRSSTVVAREAVMSVSPIEAQYNYKNKVMP